MTTAVITPDGVGPASPEAAGARKADPRFIVSPGFDAFFFLGSSLVVLIAWVATVGFHVDPFFVLAAVAVTSNAPHLTSTWTRAYMDGATLRLRPFALVGIPAMIVYGVYFTASTATNGWKYLYTVLIFWATWHFVAQCYGLLRLYQRRVAPNPTAPPDLAMRLEAASLFAWTAFALSLRLRRGPWDLFNVEVWHPPVPLWVVCGLGAVSLAALAASVVIQLARGGKQFSLVRLAFVGACFMAFYIPFNVIPHGTAGFAAAACWHGLQYLGIVWHFNRNRFAGKPAQSPKVLWWVSQPGRGHFYFAFLLAMAGSVYSVIYLLTFIQRELWFWGAVVWTGLTLSHYWVDGLIWKFKKTNLAKQLAVT